jgi:two-component system phosphate regulon sensor histidine kinase PhoR
LDTLLLISLAAAGWFAYRYFRLKSGVAELARLLSETSEENTAALSRGGGGCPRLESLRRAVADTVSEVALVRDSERRQREFQEALLNEIKDAIFILDRNREIRFVNAAAQALFPSDQPYRSRAFFDVCRDHRVYDTLDLAEEIGSKIADQITLRVPDGRPDRLRDINVLVEAEPLDFGRETGGGGSWILMKDITAQLETEQIRQDFVANASHELRTPLSIITGYLETMDEAGTDLNEPVFRRAVATMRKHGERIVRIVDDMLTISKLESAAELLAREPFDLRDSAEEIIAQLMPLIEDKHARVSVKADEDRVWTLVGDRFYWDQIFFNLIENALKQNPDPGLKITVRFEERDGRYLVTVTDDGIGIPAVDIPLIFKRFYRVQKHHAQNKVKGTGLGLSIVKRAVEAHHGRIEVESRPGIRTVFTISVPVSHVRLSDSAAGPRDLGESGEAGV